MVSILVSVPYDNDIMLYCTYTYNFENNKEVTNKELLASHGMTEESFVELAYENAVGLFKNYLFGSNE